MTRREIAGPEDFRGEIGVKRLSPEIVLAIERYRDAFKGCLRSWGVDLDRVVVEANRQVIIEARANEEDGLISLPSRLQELISKTYEDKPITVKRVSFTIDGGVIELEDPIVTDDKVIDPKIVFDLGMLICVGKPAYYRGMRGISESPDQIKWEDHQIDRPQIIDAFASLIAPLNSRTSNKIIIRKSDEEE